MSSVAAEGAPTAVDGVAVDGTAFTSCPEWFPWWQVDLGHDALIEGIDLTNSDTDPDRLRLFSLLVSQDGQHWSSVWSKVDHTPIGGPGAVFAVRLAQPARGRFVRVRADGHMALDIGGCAVLGVESYIPWEELPVPVPPTGAARRVAFSVLFAETDAYLFRLIDNFLARTDDNCVLFVNFPAARTIPPEALTLSDRVVVFNGPTPREKWGNTLLVGHLECFARARATTPAFGWFCTIASNSLFIKPFDLVATLEQVAQGHKVPAAAERSYDNDMNVPVGTVPDNATWMWIHLQGTQSLHPYLREEMGLETLSVTQIEGLFASMADWSLVYERLPAIFGMTPHLQPQFYMALEESLPVTIFNRFGSGLYTHICYMFWRGARVAGVDDVLALPHRLPAHLAMLKWFDRNPDDPATTLVTHEWGRAFTQLFDEARTLSPMAALKRRLLLRRLEDALRAREVYAPLSPLWSDARTALPTLICTARDLEVTRRMVSLAALNPAVTREDAAFVFLEGLNDRIQLSVEITPTADGDRLFIACGAGTAPPDGLDEVETLVGYLYLSPLVNAALFRVSVDVEPDAEQRRVTSRLVVHDATGYHVVTPDVVEITTEGQHHYIAARSPDPQGHVWIGLPLYRQQAVTCIIAACPS
ncbi:discoidin domain-containing protein [Ameyamaea chiangmaiensis]|uniref:Discoidin domain-containing protein n=1 Tax=Ameyamaea chiangmaiensis TaxID=442969 RepID=A0A850P743_9PROT|nr:discoidin domain-containing protein [Ameyamaea chiangmaiensis]MBS4074948.1 discoidin domain-containing protein [Ameyamaea chiangmaiensis]NVN39714.1 discoidin domain-containing protein [Ameyamaea chiangmaiensis]